MKEKEQSNGKEKNVEVISEYLKKIEGELTSVCGEVLKLIDVLLQAGGLKEESKVFYHKMKGDYYRYLAEVGCNKEEVVQCSKKSYDDAQKCATELPNTHPIRLGLALNYSVFYYEIMSEPDKACKLAKDAFDAAIADLDSVEENSYKDSTLIMQLLRDNLTLWSTQDSAGQDEQEQDE